MIFFSGSYLEVYSILFPVAVEFWLSRFDFTFCESMLSLFESILSIWETFFEPLRVVLRHMRVNYGHMVVGLWPVNAQFE